MWLGSVASKVYSQVDLLFWTAAVTGDRGVDDDVFCVAVKCLRMARYSKAKC